MDSSDRKAGSVISLTDRAALWLSCRWVGSLLRPGMVPKIRPVAVGARGSRSRRRKASTSLIRADVPWIGSTNWLSRPMGHGPARMRPSAEKQVTVELEPRSLPEQLRWAGRSAIRVRPQSWILGTQRTGDHCVSGAVLLNACIHAVEKLCFVAWVFLRASIATIRTRSEGT
jgi:hypothetical protein